MSTRWAPRRRSCFIMRKSSRLSMARSLVGFVTNKERRCGSGGQSILMIYGLIAPMSTHVGLATVMRQDQVELRQALVAWRALQIAVELVEGQHMRCLPGVTMPDRGGEHRDLTGTPVELPERAGLPARSEVGE